MNHFLPFEEGVNELNVIHLEHDRETNEVIRDEIFLKISTAPRGALLK